MAATTPTTWPPPTTRPARADESAWISIPNLARVAGLLYLILAVCGGFSELFVRASVRVAGDAAATADNIRASATLFRLEPDGYLDEFPVEIMNPTGVAFDPDGDLYVTNRAEGEVCRIERGEQAVPYATGLGVATGIAFNDDGVMFVGDRSGTIHRIDGPGRSVPFATLEPSVAAFHLAFGPDGRLYVASPGLASHDGIWAIDKTGRVRSYFKGFGRPQGLAFDTEGNLFIAACYQGRHGVVRIAEGGKSAEIFAAVPNAVGLCFTRSGDLIIATTDAAYSLPVGIRGRLLS